MSYSQPRSRKEWVHPPVLVCCSRIRTRWPDWANRLAQAQPPDPDPITMVSNRRCLPFSSTSSGRKRLARRGCSLTRRAGQWNNQTRKPTQISTGASIQKGIFGNVVARGRKASGDIMLVICCIRRNLFLLFLFLVFGYFMGKRWNYGRKLRLTDSTLRIFKCSRHDSASPRVLDRPIAYR